MFDVARQMAGDGAAVPGVAEVEEASMTDQGYLTKIYELLMAHFDESELQTLCFYLGIDYESLVGAAKPGKARALVQYCDRAGRLAELREKVMGERPLAQWPELPRSDVTRGGKEVVSDVDVWVKALEQSPTIQDPVTRQAVIAELPAPIRNSLNSHLPTLITQLRNLVKTCQNYPNGLHSLVQAVRTLEGDSLAVQQLESLL